MSEEQIIAKGKEVIRIETNAVKNLEDKIDENFVQTVDVIYKSKGRVVLTGMGKSGLIARKIVATLNSTGTAAIYMHPTDAFHGDLGMVRKDDIVIIASKGGNTEELINLIPMFRRLEVTIIAMVGNLNSRIAQLSDIVLDVSVAEEACPHDLAPTSSTTATLVMGDAVAVALIEKRGFTPDDFALLHPGGSLGKRLSLKLSEIMIKGNHVPIVNVNTPLIETIYEITSKRLGCTAVVNDKGELVGIITDGDLRRLLEKTLDMKGLNAEDIMTVGPKTIQEDYLASFALHQMEKYNITSLIITDSQKHPVGIVHIHDLIKIGLEAR
ncbi:MAG: KpsF/GutQ family sugar-phosphate isomerase [Melioribacteraceae bacterium]|nr:KpsF/GutQ family sugar-phosphate isomerase [Melioribacteraceae bacterium]